MVKVLYLQMTNQNQNQNLAREIVIDLYSDQLFLPGFFQRQAFLILNLFLPIVDFITDYINAGFG